MRRFLVWITALAGLLLLGGCGQSSGENEQPGSNVVLNVQAVPIKSGVIEETISAVGKTVATEKQKIVSPVTGTIVSINVQVGDVVSDGEKVATIRTRDSEASIAGARRLLEDAQTETQRQTAQRALDAALANQQIIPIIAHHPGTVADRRVSEGQAVMEGDDLLDLIDLSTLDFVAEIKLSDMASVKPGQICRIHFPSIPNQTFPGKIASIEPQSDINSQTVPARIIFTQAQGEIEKTLRAEMRGIADIITGVRDNALLVPQSAVIRNDITGKHHIFIISPDSLAILIPVSVGASKDSLVEISSPKLEAGMEVITDGSYEAADSMRISVTKPGQQ